MLLFDDVESILMARGNEHAKEWHFSQDSVFFHAVDDLDTSRAILVLTTNRPDLVDDAIRDRFMAYAIDYPDVELLAGLGAASPIVSGSRRAKGARSIANFAPHAAAGSVRSMRERNGSSSSSASSVVRRKAVVVRRRDAGLATALERSLAVAFDRAGLDRLDRRGRRCAGFEARGSESTNHAGCRTRCVAA